MYICKCILYICALLGTFSISYDKNMMVKQFYVYFGSLNLFSNKLQVEKEGFQVPDLPT